MGNLCYNGRLNFRNISVLVQGSASSTANLPPPDCRRAVEYGRMTRIALGINFLPALLTCGSPKTPPLSFSGMHRFMALKSTIFKINLQISDMDRSYYAAHTLTIARHPSETDERMMVRLLAFALHAHEHLTFARGGSADQEEPDLWKKDLTGAIDEWIDVGLPDEKRMLKACGRAKKVIIYAYGGSAVPLWWAGMSSRLRRLSNLSVLCLPLSDSQALAQLVERTMDLSCLIEDGEILLSNSSGSVPVTVTPLKSFS